MEDYRNKYELLKDEDGGIHLRQRQTTSVVAKTMDMIDDVLTSSDGIPFPPKPQIMSSWAGLWWVLVFLFHYFTTPWYYELSVDEMEKRVPDCFSCYLNWVKCFCYGTYDQMKRRMNVQFTFISVIFHILTFPGRLPGILIRTILEGMWREVKDDYAYLKQVCKKWQDLTVRTFMYGCMVYVISVISPPFMSFFENKLKYTVLASTYITLNVLDFQWCRDLLLVGSIAYQIRNYFQTTEEQVERYWKDAKIVIWFVDNILYDDAGNGPKQPSTDEKIEDPSSLFIIE